MAPLWTAARGAAAEVGWAAVRVAGIPAEAAAGGVRQLTGRLARVTPWLAGGGTESPPQRPGMPVLLIHGLADRASVFTVLRRGLGDCDTGPLIAVNGSALPDVRREARALGAQVQQARTDSDGAPVCLIGHSVGGLIARYYAQRLGGDAHVAAVITLGTPHSGTAPASWAPHPILRQLRPGSDLMAELAEPAPGCRTRFVALYSDLDEAVIPTHAGRIDHPDLDAQNILVHGIGHLALPHHKDVIGEIRAALTDVVETASKEGWQAA